MSNIIYTRDIPFSSHNPSSDQPIMQTNTNSIDDIITVDHYGFNDSGNRSGYHKIIHQPPQSSDPAPEAGLGQFYPKVINGQVTAFYQSDTGTVFNVVNKSVSGLVDLPTNGSATLAGIIPDNCIGFLILQRTSPVSGVSPNAFFYSFSTYIGIIDVQHTTVYLQAPPVPSAIYTSFPISTVTPYVIAAGGGGPGNITLLLNNKGVPMMQARYRYIYWPTL